MPQSRREFMRTSLQTTFATLMAGGFLPSALAALDWNKAAFDSKSFKEALSALGINETKNSTSVVIDAADIAEDGRVVPIAVISNVPGTESIALVVEKNPSVLAAVFNIPKDTLPQINTRIKMAETCNVYALVRAGGAYSMAAREIKVTLGGCGG